MYEKYIIAYTRIPRKIRSKIWDYIQDSDPYPPIRNTLSQRYMEIFESHSGGSFTNNRYIVYDREADYLMFLLKWS
jgi:hypothetical protein